MSRTRTRYRSSGSNNRLTPWRRARFALQPLFYAVRRIKGLRVAIRGAGDPDRIFSEIESALGLIEALDPIRFRRIRADLTGGIWVEPQFTTRAHFDSRVWSCVFNARNFDDHYDVAIASMLVHEATHARLWRAGVRYEEPLRYRVERACYRQQLNFVRRLPAEAGRDAWVAYQSAELAALSAENYSDAAFLKRRDLARWRHLRDQRARGVPAWLIRATTGFGESLRRVRE